MKNFYVYVYSLPCGTPYYVGKAKEQRKGSLRHLAKHRYCEVPPEEQITFPFRGTEQEVLLEEERLITLYGREKEGGTLKNIKSKGSGGSEQCKEETKIKISESLKRAHAEGRAKGFTATNQPTNRPGNTQERSAEQRAKISEGLKGNTNRAGTKPTEATKAKLRAARERQWQAKGCFTEEDKVAYTRRRKATEARKRYAARTAA